MKKFYRDVIDECNQIEQQILQDHKLSKKQMKKLNRRRAIDCKLVDSSKKNPGYFKYDVTIKEKDGTTHTEPAYGVDMQDAISRLIWKERSIKIEKKMSAGWIFVVWLAVMGWPAFYLSESHQPLFVLYMFGGVALILVLLAWWYNYLNKN